MYYLYERTSERDVIRFRRLKSVCLFGCRSGTIPRLLLQKLNREAVSASEPLDWHVPVASELTHEGITNGTLLIDLKPQQKKENISIYELLDVWGVSRSGWTPVMLRLRGLYVDELPTVCNPRDFSVVPPKEHSTIYSFLYLNGALRDGRLDGKWVAPPRSSTNSPLLWPNSLQYFVSKIQETAPHVLRVLDQGIA